MEMMAKLKNYQILKRNNSHDNTKQRNKKIIFSLFFLEN